MFDDNDKQTRILPYFIQNYNKTFRADMKSYPLLKRHGQSSILKSIVIIAVKYFGF